MIPDKILYTDGRDVTVTDSKFQVKNTEYRVNGITKIGLMILRPHRAPGIAMLLAGSVLLLIGLMKLISPSVVPDMELGSGLVSANQLAAWIGGFLIVTGLLVVTVIKERYAVRIATAEGEKDAVVSTRKEYITQIIDALNQAATYVRTKTASRYFSTRNM
jgi:hypothetical protein